MAALVGQAVGKVDWVVARRRWHGGVGKSRREQEREKSALLNFDPVSTHKKYCNRPKIVAIAEIATLFFRWEALQALAWVKLWTTLF
jgi:hypothetical protein